MNRLKIPERSGSEVFDLCVKQISDVHLKLRLEAQKEKLEGEYQKYEAHSKSQEWYTLKRAEHAKKEQKVVGDITKGELMNLYTT